MGKNVPPIEINSENLERLEKKVLGKKKVKGKDSVVRIDSELLSDVEAFIKKRENKYKYMNRKQFIDLAVFEKLNKEVKHGK